MTAGIIVAVFIILLIIATLTGIGYYYYQNYYSNPQKVVDKIIDTAKKIRKNFIVLLVSL